MNAELYYDAVDLLKDLIRTPRVSRNETEAANIIAAWLTSHELSPQRLHNNVWVTDPDFDPSRPTLLLNSHIDTVDIVDGWTRDPHAAEVDDSGRLYGIGSNDAGASLTSLAAAFAALVTEPRNVNFIFLASAEEEVSGSKGITGVIPLLGPIDAALVGEPTGMNPAIAEKGLMVLDGTVKGIAGHAARDEGDNAIYKAVEVVNRLASMTFGTESPMLGPIKVTVTGINAGTRHNVIPGECNIMVDVRTTDALSNEETLRRLQQAAGSDVVLTPRSTRLQPSSIDPSHPLVRRAVIMGGQPYGSPTLSDQALLRVPSLKMGPGHPARSHTADEYITLDELREGMELYHTLLSGIML